MRSRAWTGMASFPQRAGFDLFGRHRAAQRDNATALALDVDVGHVHARAVRQPHVDLVNDYSHLCLPGVLLSARLFLLPHGGS
jgi:hypothetical protein